MDKVGKTNDGDKRKTTILYNMYIEIVRWMCLDCTCNRYQMCMELKSHMGECLLEPPKPAGLKDYPDCLQVPPTHAIELSLAGV